MKKELKSFIIIGLMFFSVIVYSQEKRFVEVIVSDTIELKAIQITYKISIGQSYEFMGMKVPDKTSEKEDLPSISDITAILDKEKIKYSLSDEQEYTISTTESKPDILIVLKDETELKKLYNTLKSAKGISGKINEVAYEPISKYLESSYKKIYSKALYQASLLAKTTNNSLGKVISINTVSGDTNNYMDYYKQLMKSTNLGMFNTNNAFPKKEEIKMSFKFELN